MTNIKKCTKCNKIKKVSKFRKQKLGYNGLHASCKSCEGKYSKKYAQEHKESRNIISRRWKKRNKKHISEYGRKYAKEHKQEKQIRIKNRIKNDPKFKIECRLRQRILKAIKGTVKSMNTLLLIGCDADYVMYHLQKQFKKGMTWDNHGDWHIDHIISCASFDLNKPSQQRKCFHYTNLQPLWARENISKRNKLPKNLESHKWTKDGWKFIWK